MARQPLDLAEWELVLNKMLRYHFNISEEIKAIVIAIRKEMKPELIPLAEERANFGKTIKLAIRAMWGTEYEIDDVQKDFAGSIGKIDIENLTDDFIEDMLLQSKPLQIVLYSIRVKQKGLMEDMKAKYWDAIKDLEPMPVVRPDREALRKKSRVESAPGAATAAAPAEPAPAVEAVAAPPVEAAA